MTLPHSISHIIDRPRDWARAADSPAEFIVAYGGGVDTVAMLVLLFLYGWRPRAILMSDPGDEWRRSIEYRENVIRPWCARVGFPDPVVVSRATESAHRPLVRSRPETLREECERTMSLPSAAYGKSRCSQKYKAEPAFWWVARQEWAKAERAAGRRIAKAIGYNADEDRRAHRTEFGPEWERNWLFPWYPLYKSGVDRDGCVELIRAQGLPVPGKSACTFCPNATPAEWLALRREEPEAWERALEMSRRADATVQTDGVGLIRRNKVGKRSLHVWAESLPASDDEDPMFEEACTGECGV